VSESARGRIHSAQSDVDQTKVVGAVLAVEEDVDGNGEGNGGGDVEMKLAHDVDLNHRWVSQKESRRAQDRSMMQIP